MVDAEEVLDEFDRGILHTLAALETATVREVKMRFVGGTHAAARALWRLHERGLVRRVARGKYEVTDGGREALR